MGIMKYKDKKTRIINIWEKSMYEGKQKIQQ